MYRISRLYLLMFALIGALLVIAYPGKEVVAAEAVPCDEANPDCDSGGGGDGGCSETACTCSNSTQVSYSNQCEQCQSSPWGNLPNHWKGFVSITKQCPCSTRTITCWYTFGCGGCDAYR